MAYRGYDLEEKALLVGWQIAIRTDDKFVRNGAVVAKLSTAMEDARAYVDGVIAGVANATPGKAS